MSHIDAAVEVDGTIARLRKLSDSYAVIRGFETSLMLGDGCAVTLYGELLGRPIELTLQSEVVRRYGDIVEVMFVPPSPNWQRIYRALKRYGGLMEVECAGSA